jgi:hypothetical protein
MARKRRAVEPIITKPREAEVALAKGLDLMPECGYPPVRFGVRCLPRAAWHGMTAGHNTVVVDGENQHSGAGKATLWGDGKQFHAVRTSVPTLIGGSQQLEGVNCASVTCTVPFGR